MKKYLILTALGGMYQMDEISKPVWDLIRAGQFYGVVCTDVGTYYNLATENWEPIN